MNKKIRLVSARKKAEMWIKLNVIACSAVNSGEHTRARAHRMSYKIPKIKSETDFFLSRKYVTFNGVLLHDFNLIPVQSSFHSTFMDFESINRRFYDDFNIFCHLLVLFYEFYTCRICGCMRTTHTHTHRLVSRVSNDFNVSMHKNVIINTGISKDFRVE